MLSLSCEARTKASCSSSGRSGRGKLTSSYETNAEFSRRISSESQQGFETHLEALRVPSLDFLDARHLVQPLR